VVLPVSRQEGNGDIVVLEDVDGCWGVAPGSQRIDRCDGVVAFELLEAGSTNHCNMDGFWVKMLESVLLGKLERGSILPWKWVGRCAMVRIVVGKFLRYVADDEEYEWFRLNREGREVKWVFKKERTHVGEVYGWGGSYSILLIWLYPSITLSFDPAKISKRQG
jgi:hypothetical protein